ncbi:MAG: hypothetical protein BWY31_01927 [Lentisphaerae bacterium ADurb.Bin242]|nr:MAG: hypothetical protein BWY31_01927 [Lentisphaerae bacterium ADurb.Bin242]
MNRNFLPVAFAFCLILSAGAEDFSTTFADGQWDRSLWLNVKSPRFDYVGEMVQHGDYIVNKTPNLPDETIFKKHGSDVYASLVFHKKFTGSAVISSRMSFDHRMAPLIVIAPELGKSKDGIPEFREHFEIVLFDEGINVWRHLYTDGKPSWYKAAFLKTSYLPKTVYDLQVELRFVKQGCQMILRCEGKEFGYLELNLPDSYYAGIIACEGRNRFYDFKVVQPKPKPARK